MPINRQLAAIGLVLVILFPMVVPATASWPGDSTRAADPTANVPVKETQAIAENESPRALKGRAIERLASMPTHGWFDQRFRKRAIRLLNGTVEYRDGTRVSRASMFRDDQRALGLVAPLAWTNRSMAEEVARFVVHADLVTVNTSISDAKRAQGLVHDRIEDRIARMRADRAIERSIQARDRAIATLEKDRVPWRSVHRRRALLHLRVAWSHANRALDILSRAAAPIIEIRTRSDPPGGEVIGNRTIDGVVSHVRAYELGNVSVTVNGTSVASAPLETSTDPVENASFGVNLTLDRAAAVVAVTVTRNGSDEAVETGRRGWWDRFERFTRRGSWSTHGARHARSAKDESGVGTASVRFDGDGLPDRFETGWSNTDPLDPDSDAKGTDTDEGGNDRPDGAEDFDGDGLLAYEEYDLGTDPSTADSDTDGLPDRFEARLQALLDASNPDTDGDGRQDGMEDFDGDGLPARAEYANGTSIATADSDNDGLDDGAEVHLHLTNPLDSDSDSDGLKDGEELRLGSDPLLTDTDGNGIVDSEEVFRTHVTDNETGVSISLLGGGDVASRVEVESIAQPTKASFLVGPVVRIQNHSLLDSATVALPINNASSRLQRNVSVYTWNPGRDRHWRPLQSRIDQTNRTVSANVSSFSYFTAMDAGEWQSAISDSISLGWPRHESFVDLDGWTTRGSVTAEGGRLVVSGRSGSDGTPDIVVAADGSGDFNRVQNGVYAAEPGDTLLVKAGVYPETVVVDRPLSIVGDGAVLNGKALGEHAFHGIKIETERLSVRGFTIRNYHRNIDARETTADVDISETIFRRGGWGINAQGSVGDWTLTDVEMVETFIDGIQADESGGDWTLRGVHANGSMESGISAQGAVGEWSLRDVEFSGHEDFGLRLNGTAGTWTIHEAVIASNGRHGIAATANDGTISVNHSQIVGNGAAGVGATNGANLVDAIGNWWGQAGGPRPGQILGNVDASSACSTPSCGKTSQEFRSMPELTEEPVTHAKGRQQQIQTGARSVSRRELALPGDVSAILVSARWRGTAGGVSHPRLRVVGGQEEEIIASATSTRDAFTTETADVSRFAGRTVTLEATASGDGQIEIEWIDVAYDTDGDGLRDAIERADLGMPTGPRPGASLSALDPTDPDTDGDGLEDGEELTDVIVRVDAADNPGGMSFQASEATSDPTIENSDGGGLNDAEEVKVGSDPFVLETLVVGYTLPTMTHGPGDTLADRKPMTVAQSDGILVGAGQDVDFITWPSGKYFDPIFCIQELTQGPGCSPDWMIGVDIQDDRHYVRIPFIVYAESNTELGNIHYEMIFTTVSGATYVKGTNTSGLVEPGNSRRGYAVFEMPDLRVAEEGQPGALRGIGKIRLSSHLSESVFARNSQDVVQREFAVPTNTLMPATEQMLDDTQFVVEQGINVAMAAESGVSVAVSTGSTVKGAIAFLYELSLNQIDSTPHSIEESAMKTSIKGISSFKKKIQLSESDIYETIYGDGVLRGAGPTMVRNN